MNRTISLAAVAGVCLLLFACATNSPPPAGLVISNVTVISPERTGSLTHAYVRIVAGRIADVSDRRLRGETEIDGTGGFLIPGLIDSHVHLAVAPKGFPAPMTVEQAGANPKIVAAALAQDPESFLFFGFTTVVDLYEPPSVPRTGTSWTCGQTPTSAGACRYTRITTTEFWGRSFPTTAHRYSTRSSARRRKPPLQSRPMLRARANRWTTAIGKVV
jgi:hypothetical protein